VVDHDHQLVENNADTVPTAPDRIPVATFTMASLKKLKDRWHHQELAELEDLNHHMVRKLRLIQCCNLRRRTKSVNPDHKSHASREMNAKTGSVLMLTIQMSVHPDHQRSHVSREDSALTPNARTATTWKLLNSTRDHQESRTLASKALLAPKLTVPIVTILTLLQFK